MILKGNPVSGGIALGPLFLYRAFDGAVQERYFPPGREAHFLQAYLGARAIAAQELDAITASFPPGDPQGDIFLAHREILLDTELDSLIRAAIGGERAMPDFAVERALAQFIRTLGASSDPMMAARTADLRDVGNRLIRLLRGEAEQNLSGLKRQAIVVARDLLPSDTATMDRAKVLGIVTELGGATSHSAILARSFGIPAVLGVADATKLLRGDTFAALDAMEGTLECGERDALMARYAPKLHAFRNARLAASAFRAREPRMADGTRIDIGLNVGAPRAEDYDHCDFIGLLRTEFLYLHARRLPTEEEQLHTYKTVLARAGGRPVTLRTFDLGGDKPLPYLPRTWEENPALGLRALRVCFDHPDLLQTQLRAALRASHYGPLSIMFPMMGSMEDIARAKAALSAAKRALRAEGAPFDEGIKMGVMIEVPALAMMADLVARAVDFASIGTNDLCQYLCAADRLNPAVAQYYQSLSPAMLRVIDGVVSVFTAQGKPISVCGELGGDPAAAVALVGLGVRKLSMSSAAVPRVKHALSRVTLREAEATARTLLGLTTEGEIKTALAQLLEEHE